MASLSSQLLTYTAQDRRTQNVPLGESPESTILREVVGLIASADLLHSADTVVMCRTRSASPMRPILQQRYEMGIFGSLVFANGIV